MAGPIRPVVRSETFLERARKCYGDERSLEGRPSFKDFEDGALRGIEEMFSRAWETLPEGGVNIRVFGTHQTAFFDPMIVYGVLVAGDDGQEWIELVDIEVDFDYLDKIEGDPTD